MSSDGKKYLTDCLSTQDLLIVIPKGVAHGYRVLGVVPVTLFYHTTESYDPKNLDEERIEFDDPGIGFDWRTKNK